MTGQPLDRYRLLWYGLGRGRLLSYRPLLLHRLWRCHTRLRLCCQLVPCLLGLNRGCSGRSRLRSPYRLLGWGLRNGLLRLCGQLFLSPLRRHRLGLCHQRFLCRLRPKRKRLGS